MTTTVTVIDEIAIPRDRVEEWSRRWRSDYLPGAGDRGMRVVRQCRRFTSPDTVMLEIQWELPGIYEFYGMRAWEQEFADLDGLNADYLLHPYHWTCVDRWFDPEIPDSIVDPAIAHLYRWAEGPLLS